MGRFFNVFLLNQPGDCEKIGVMKGKVLGLLVLLLFAMPAAVQAQSGSGDGFNYSINGSNANTITITNYTGSDGVVIIPTNINNLLVTGIGNGVNSVFTGSLISVTIPSSVTSIGHAAFEACTSLISVTIANSVTSIGDGAFDECNSLTNLTIPSSVTNIEGGAFAGCENLTGIYFTGNVPTYYMPFLGNNDSLIVYYMSGTTGWSDNIEGVPVLLWNPLIQTGDGSFGVQNKQFGFNITGTNNFTVVVEACTNLANPVWTPLQAVTLTNGSSYFSDPQWTNYPNRFYGLGLP